MSVADQAQSLTVTEHGLLVAYGHFAQTVGLIKSIERVSFNMKTVDRSPADKVMELLSHILSGVMHINELAKSAHPLVRVTLGARSRSPRRLASASCCTPFRLKPSRP